MENKDILNALQNYEMTFGTSENIFNGGLLTDAERDFVMRDSNAFLFGLIADQSVKAETAWSLPYKLAQRLEHFSMQKIAKESSSEVASAIGLIGGMIIYFFIFIATRSLTEFE